MNAYILCQSSLLKDLFLLSFSLFQKVHYIACDVSGQYSDVQKAVDKVRISFKALKYQYTVLLRSYKNLKTHFASTVKASCNFAPCIDTCLNWKHDILVTWHSSYVGALWTVDLYVNFWPQFCRANCGRCNFFTGVREHMLIPMCIYLQNYPFTGSEGTGRHRFPHQLCRDFTGIAFRRHSRRTISGGLFYFFSFWKYAIILFLIIGILICIV